jgi:carboxylesterase type B
MNIVIPHAPRLDDKPFPVLVYVHGGSLLYGGANLPIFDAVNLVTHSVAIGLPIICVNFNYRVGIGGFLAGQAIAKELQRDGHAGSGNFGFTDQQVAFDWVQKYIGFLGGDIDNVTAVGESAGGISISNQLLAARPPVFHRAVCMSGLSSSIPAFTMEQHDRSFEDVCRHFQIDPASLDALDQLRAIPQQELANATPVIQGVPAGTGNPCLDGWFYRPMIDPRQIHAPPSWLKGYMIGDVYHEGIIFHINLLDENYASIKHVMKTHIKDDAHTDGILSAYGITEDLPHDILLEHVEHMCGDAIFKIPNYVMSQECMRQGLLEDNLFLYHFDQRSRIKNLLEGTAYHAHELLYLFGNLDNEMDEQEKVMAREFAAAWIRFVNGVEPWRNESGRKWKVWGPDSRMEVKSEAEDEEVRGYARMERVLRLGNGKVWMKWVAAVDALVNKRKLSG